jgi:hypothetical protein
MKYQNADASMTSGWGGSTDDLHELPGGIEESVGGGDRDPPGPKDGVVGTLFVLVFRCVNEPWPTTVHRDVFKWYCRQPWER